jgi:soluble epoxide hydrolase / lipid-phosphate phosphatase
MPTYQVSRGFEYFYLHTPPSPSSSSAKYVLFLHGWPSVSHEWHYQIDHFRRLGYGIIAPDLLGSGRTSRPTEPEKYLLKDMAKDVIEILNHENIARVDAVGHDWGSHLLGRVAVYFPERLGRICFIAVGYRPPGAPTNLDAINEMTAQKLGYAIFGYQVFFTQDEKAEAILNQHVSLVQ